MPARFLAGGGYGTARDPPTHPLSARKATPITHIYPLSGRSRLKSVQRHSPATSSTPTPENTPLCF
jgi:hypothetical protein